jgi:hypothetical protein
MNSASCGKALLQSTYAGFGDHSLCAMDLHASVGRMKAFAVTQCTYLTAH